MLANSRLPVIDWRCKFAEFRSNQCSTFASISSYRTDCCRQFFKSFMYRECTLPKKVLLALCMKQYIYCMIINGFALYAMYIQSISPFYCDKCSERSIYIPIKKARPQFRFYNRKRSYTHSTVSSDDFVFNQHIFTFVKGLYFVFLFFLFWKDHWFVCMATSMSINNGSWRHFTIMFIILYSIIDNSR